LGVSRKTIILVYPQKIPQNYWISSYQIGQPWINGKEKALDFSRALTLCGLHRTF
jgi:hypothetical protein